MNYRSMTEDELSEADHGFAKALDPDPDAVFEACYTIRRHAETQRKLIRRERWRRATIARWALQIETGGFPGIEAAGKDIAARLLEMPEEFTEPANGAKP